MQSRRIHTECEHHKWLWACYIMREVILRFGTPFVEILKVIFSQRLFDPKVLWRCIQTWMAVPSSPTYMRVMKSAWHTSPQASEHVTTGGIHVTTSGMHVTTSGIHVTSSHPGFECLLTVMDDRNRGCPTPFLSYLTKPAPNDQTVTLPIPWPRRKGWKFL